MISIIPRAQWGARPPIRALPIAVPTPQLWLHHSASSGTDARAVRGIQDFHMDVRRWSDIAYSFLVDDDPEFDEDVFEGRGAGVAGGHTKGQNTVSHAICIIGNYTSHAPRDTTLHQVTDLVVHGYRSGWWPLGFSGGHRDVGATSCPGDALYRLIPEINAEAARRAEGVGLPIMGPATASLDQAISLDWSTAHHPLSDVRRILDVYWTICDAEGVDFGAAVPQMRHETRELAYTGDVHPSQLNFAGVGATGGVPGESWDTIEAGVRGHVRRLRMYAEGHAGIYNVSILKRALSRIHWGKYPTVELAGKTWGTDPLYVQKWLVHIAELRDTKPGIQPTYPDALEAWEWAESAGLLSASSIPTDQVAKQDLMVHLKRGVDQGVI